MLQQGRKLDARQEFATIWAEIESNPEPFHECTLAHYMADAQDDVTKELAWDLRALHAAEGATDEAAKAHHESLSIQEFFPSLHLNLGDDYFRIGDFSSSRRHLEAGLRCADVLSDAPYSTTLRRGFERLAARLDELGS
jgi:hypothetical protein